jgi:energy-coupling factor transporter ATP-binding protein EcfA2
MKRSAQITQEAKQLIEGPRLLYRAARKIGELGVVGEVRIRLIIFLACLTMWLDEKVSVLVTGPSSSGKSTIVDKVTTLYPPESVITRASFSRKAIAKGKESFENKILYVYEFSGSKEARQLIRHVQTEGEVSHEYSAGDDTKVAQRIGSPVVLSTTTEGKIFEDDATRFLTVRVTESPKHILAVLKAPLRHRESQEPCVEVWRQAIRLLGERVPKRFPLPDWLGYVAEQVPRERPRVQRDWKRSLGLLKAVALCQARDEPEIRFEDYCILYHILNPALTATMHAINEHEIAVRTAVVTLSNELGHGVTGRQVREQLNWSKTMAYKYIEAAQEHKLIRCESGTRVRNKLRLLPVAGAVGKFLPSPKQVLKNAQGLGESVRYIDPLTGKTKVVRR